MESALQNPLILSNIFSYLDFASLKSARVMCAVWADVAAHPLGKKSVLQVNKLFPQCCTVTPIPHHFPPRMAVHVDISLKCGGIVTGNYSHSPKKEGRAAAANISTFLSTCHKSIETIKVTNNFAWPVFESLAKLEFPKLKTFRLVGGDFCNGSTYKEDMSPFPVRKSITCLEFKVPREFGKFMDEFYPVFQKLIESAPNLEALKILECFTPSLTTCKNLKVLDYCGFPEDYEIGDSPRHEFGEFDMESMLNMMEEVKDSLQVLKIGCRHDLFCCHVMVELDDYEIPVMTKLENIFVNGIVFEGLKRALRKGKSFPKLQAMRLTSKYEPDRSEHTASPQQESIYSGVIAYIFMINVNVT